MTARPLRAPLPRQRPRVRVIGGRAPRRRPMVGPFVVFGLVVVASMIGIVMARTSLDAGAFDLADLNRKIAVEQQRQQTLTVEAARLESPGRIAPLADKMGLVQAQDPTILVVGEAASNDATSNANLAMEQRP